MKRCGLLGPEGIILGKWGRRGLLLRSAGPTHVFIAAATRSGKGAGFVVPNLLDWPGSVVVFDIKGENHELTAGFRAFHGHEVILFDPILPFPTVGIHCTSYPMTRRSGFATFSGWPQTCMAREPGGGILDTAGTRVVCRRSDARPRNAWAFSLSRARPSVPVDTGSRGRPAAGICRAGGRCKQRIGSLRPAASTMGGMRFGTDAGRHTCLRTRTPSAVERALAGSCYLGQ